MGQTADSYPPVPGECWMNIHTSKKLDVKAIKPNPNPAGGLMVVMTDDRELDMPTFVANWKRVKGASCWFLGAMPG